MYIAYVQVTMPATIGTGVEIHVVTACTTSYILASGALCEALEARWPSLTPRQIGRIVDSMKMRKMNPGKTMRQAAWSEVITISNR